MEPEVVEAETTEDVTHFYKRLGEICISAGERGSGEGRIARVSLVASAPTVGLMVLANSQGEGHEGSVVLHMAKQ